LQWRYINVVKGLRGVEAKDNIEYEKEAKTKIELFKYYLNYRLKYGS